MDSPKLILALLFTSAATLSTVLTPWHHRASGSRSEGSALAVLMGDSRRIFAEHVFAKADLYFHSGYYPSIFDAPKRAERSHMEESVTASPATDVHGESGTAEDHHEHDENYNHGDDEKTEETAHAEEHHEHNENCNHGAEGGDPDEAPFLNKPRDIIDAFGRNFFITRHTHLGEGQQREMLPWLKVAAELDPQKVETYTVASYWLRSKLNKTKEAEAFLREGLRANPDSYEILFELGRIQKEHYSNPTLARNLWEIAVAKWRKQELAGLKPDEFTYAHILGFLGNLEEEQGNFASAIHYFEELKTFSPSKEVVEKRIAELKEAAVKGSKPSGPGATAIDQVPPTQ